VGVRSWNFRLRARAILGSEHFSRTLGRSTISLKATRRSALSSEYLNRVYDGVDTYFRHRPFGHLLIAPVLNAPLEGALLSEFERFGWERRADTFYRFDVPRDGASKARILAMMHAPCLEIKSVLEPFLGCNLNGATQLEIHRYGKGDGIGPHTDAATPEVRCVININSGWSIADGAIWALAADSALNAERTQLPSISNSAFAFSTGSTTFHALSIRYAGIGYAVTIRFPRR